MTNLAKCMFMVVVEDDQVETVTNSIQAAASTGFPGDGRVFVTSVESAFTLRGVRPVRESPPANRT